MTLAKNLIVRNYIGHAANTEKLEIRTLNSRVDMLHGAFGFLRDFDLPLLHLHIVGGEDWATFGASRHVTFESQSRIERLRFLVVRFRSWVAFH